jgi:hypothetical protein
MTSFSHLMAWSEFSSSNVSIQLIHVDSEFCWCDPMVELDENSDGIVIHREVTWN